MGCEGWVGVWKRTMLFKSIFKIAYGWLGLLSWQCQTFKQSKHSIHPYLLHTHYISMLLTAIWTWAGDHSKTNILDIMYISDFYSRAASFLPAWSWNHWLRGGSAMPEWKIQHQGIALNEAFNIIHFFQCLKYPMYSIEHNTNVDSLASGLLYPLAYECAVWKCRVL